MFYDDVFKNLKEKDIQELYFRHPYLIDKSFEEIIPEQYYKLSSGIADLVLFNKDEIIVIELKIEFLKKTHVLQLAQYTKEILKLFPSKEVKAILIGRQPKEELSNLINTFSYNFGVIILNKDIPIQIKICQRCRIANSIMYKKCWKCGEIKWL